MTRSNRTLNRLVLALVALLALAGAAALAWPAAARAHLEVAGLVVPPAPRLGLDALLAGPDRLGVAGAAAAVALVALLLAVAWAASRGRGGTATVVDVDGVRIDIHAVRDLLQSSLGPTPAVVGVGATAHRLRGRTALRVTVLTRRHADLPALLDGVRTAIDDLDAALGARVPVVVRVRTGLRSSFAREQRAE
jgi:hypothetical protein